MADNTMHLLHAAAARRANALDAARAALRHLELSGKPITFSGVAAEAGVSRSWLYSDPEVRAEIERLRATNPAPSAPVVPAAQRTNRASLRQRLDATREEINRLRAENAALRDQLARSLGEQRAQR
ncbi:MAG: DUF6262 family protein [Dehalococcoidia bacterium]